MIEALIAETASDAESSSEVFKKDVYLFRGEIDQASNDVGQPIGHELEVTRNNLEELYSRVKK